MAAEGGGDGGCGGGGAVGGNETAGMSPKNRVKLLCSHGGKILPRPTDGVLKYVGGETRVVAFSRDANFSDLMQKLSTVFDGDLVLKYQLIPEDLDALVSVKTDEDLRHMLDEYERQEADGTPRLRAFLFPSTPVVVLDVQITSTEAHALEQRYIEAVNGVVRMPPTLKIIPPKPSLASFTISSACSSPKSLSPDHFSHDPNASHESLVPRSFMHKVRSSPSLYSLNQQTADTHIGGPLVYQHPHHYHQNYQQYHHPGFQSARPPQDPSKGAAGERPISGLSKGKADSWRGLMGSGPCSYYSSARQHKGFGSGTKHVHLEEGCGYGGKRLDRADTIPRSVQPAIWE